VELLKHRHGDTDSELAFLWFLTRMVEDDIDLDSCSPDLARLMAVMGRSVRQLAEWCFEVEAEQPRLNFLLTEGTVLIGSRWNHTLYWVSRVGIHDCEICGIPHIRHRKHADYRARMVASEPISRESWEEIPDRHVFGIDQAIQARVEPIN
jgi:glutamine amidotransferase